MLLLLRFLARQLDQRLARSLVEGVEASFLLPLAHQLVEYPWAEVVGEGACFRPPQLPWDLPLIQGYPLAAVGEASFLLPLAHQLVACPLEEVAGAEACFHQPLRP